MNNVETLANIPAIIIKGANWFNKIGTERSKGTKVFALAGKINNVGLIEDSHGNDPSRSIYEIAAVSKTGRNLKPCKREDRPEVA